MNTKTMRLPPRRLLTPSTNGSGSGGTKRKEREDPFERPKPVTTKLVKPDKPRPGSEPISSSKEGLEASNQLLAGYLAHEYLTRGTLLGQPWAPPRAEKEKGKGKPSSDGEEGEEEGEAPPYRRAEEEEEKKKKRERYVEVAGLLKGGGAHLPGVFNPTQLARFLHL